MTMYCKTTVDEHNPPYDPWRGSIIHVWKGYSSTNKYMEPENDTLEDDFPLQTGLGELRFDVGLGPPGRT